MIRFRRTPHTPGCCRSALPAPLLALCAGLALPACSTDQAADVATYRQISDPPGPPPTLGQGDPLPLVTALRLTAAYNESLAIQGERYVQALAERQRRASALRPTLDFFTDADLRENAGNAGIVQTDVGITGQYRFLTGLSDLRNVSAAEARADSARWLVLDLRETLLVQVALAYYDTLRAERLAAVLRNSVRAQIDRLSDAKARNEAGFTRPLDVAQIEAQVSRTRAQLIAADRQQEVSRSALTLLTNADLRASPLTDEFDIPDPPPAMQDLLALARIHRQDVLAARSNADAARSTVDAEIGAYAPSIGVNLDYFLINAPERSAADLGALFQLRLPIFSAGNIEARVRAAWSAFRETVLTYRLRERQAASDVEAAHVRLLASIRLVEELRTQVRVARDSLTLAEAAYQAGLGTNLERIVAQDQLLAAELEEVSATFTVKTSYLELLRAAGLLSHDLISTPLPEAPAYAVPDSPFLDRRTGTPALLPENSPTLDEGATP